MNGENPKRIPGEFSTPDLYFAAYLQTAGTPMLRADRPNGRVFFVFDAKSKDIEALKTSWFNSQGEVKAHPYANALKALKSLCHMG